MIPLWRKSQKKGRLSGNIFSVIAGLVLFGAIGYLAIADWRIYRTGAKLQRQVRILQNEIQKLEQKNAELEKLLASTKTEEYLEQTARERLNLKKPGEQVVAIVPPEKQEEKQQLTKQNFWQKILEKIPFLPKVIWWQQAPLK